MRWLRAACAPGSRCAQQLVGTAQKFSRAELENALVALYEADKDLRRPRPDDRLIMESLLLKLTR